MSTMIQHEIMEVVSKLDDSKQLQVLEFVRSLDENQTQFEMVDWLQRMRKLRQKLLAKYGPNHFPAVQAMIDEVREERLDDIMRSLTG